MTLMQVGKREVRIPKMTRIKLIDFGCATYDDDEHKSALIATRQYRAPEVPPPPPPPPPHPPSMGCLTGTGDAFPYGRDDRSTPASNFVCPPPYRRACERVDSCDV